MQWLQYSTPYLWVGLIGSYVVITSYFLAKLFKKYGQTEIFWFVLLNLLYPFILIYTLWEPDYKNRLTEKDKKILFISIVGLILLILSIIIPVIIIDKIDKSESNGYSIISLISEYFINPFDKLPDWMLLPLVLLVPFYYFYVAFWITSLINKLGEKRSWFYATLFFHILIVVYVLLNKSYRKRLTLKQIIQVVFCGIGYFICAVVAKTAIDI